jgi:membrane dipeptidase
LIVVDAHEDIAFNMLVHGRDYRYSALNQRKREANTGLVAGRGIAMIGLPDALLGRVAVIFATLFTEPYRRSGSLAGGPVYDSAEQAYELASRQMDAYERLADEQDRVQLMRREDDLDTVLASWAEDTEIGDHRVGLAILMENADPILEPKQFEEWYERGVRLVGPAWKASRYCGGTGEPGSLTDLGHELLEVMAGYKVVLDLSHMAEAAFLEAVESYDGPIIASHSNPRRFCNTDRHLSDDMIHRLCERDGVMGIVMFNKFLTDDWDVRRRLPFEVVLEAIDYVCQLTGSAAHVGIGTDFDGGFGMESAPEGLDTVTDLLRIGAALRERGYAEADIEAVLAGNMLRKLRESLTEA